MYARNYASRDPLTFIGCVCHPKKGSLHSKDSMQIVRSQDSPWGWWNRHVRRPTCSPLLSSFPIYSEHVERYFTHTRRTKIKQMHSKRLLKFTTFVSEFFVWFTPGIRTTVPTVLKLSNCARTQLKYQVILFEATTSVFKNVLMNSHKYALNYFFI